MISISKLEAIIKWFVLLSFIPHVILQNMENDRLIAELQMDDLELIDMCEDLASAEKFAVLNQNYHNKTEQQLYYGSVIKTHYNVLRQFTRIPPELERNWTYQVKPGDALLAQDKWKQMVLYQNRLEELTIHSKLFCQNQTEFCITGKSKSKYQYTLNSERNFERLKSYWESWQKTYNDPDIEEFKKQLTSVKQAATLNDFPTVREYWESLSDFQGAYKQAEVFWGEISPFYNKLHRFVRSRLFKYYNISSESTQIPVFLLGGELGTDWSNIADIILPHPQLHYDVESYLNLKNIETLYKFSESLSENLGLGSFGKNFWTKSNLSSTICGPQLFEFCRQGYTEILDCDKTSWPIYLNCHKTAMKIALNNLDYSSLPRQRLRYCAIDDTVEELGTLLAIESLEHYGILEANDIKSDDDSPQMTRLLLAALRIMPGLAYSIMADKWRMELIEQNVSNVVDSWWRYREKYTGIGGTTLVHGHEYLEDSRIVSNKPYITKFFGTLIAFQLYSYYKERAEDGVFLAKDFGQDDTFITMIKNRHTTDWPYLLTIHYGLDLSTAEILKYFEPLESYFETAPQEQVAITTTTAAPISTTTTTTEAPYSAIPKISLESEVYDQPKLNTSTMNLNVTNVGAASIVDNHIMMYVGVGITIIVGCVLLTGLAYKTLRKKRRTNNRRFDT